MSILLRSDSKLADVIIAEPTVITVLNRFGIKLGVGDDTIADACAARQLDVDFFTTILNTYINEEYFPERVLAGFSPSVIVDYLGKTNAYYERFQLPNIERHFSLLISKSDSVNNNLVLMRQFFFEVKNELLRRIADDRQRWFPLLLEQEKTGAVPAGAALEQQAQENDEIEDKIDDLIHMMVIHLSGDYDMNLGVAVLYAIFALSKDIKMNNRVRNRLLKPLSRQLTQ